MKNDAYLDMELLRFSTAGSVDDGKSTLIGRLLYDSKSIFEDQMQSIEEASRNRGTEEVNLALLTDGLRAEREQGITIDVAYRYFATPKRKFIIADTPGHVQYTRNMVTGASTTDLAVILIDSRHGVVEQTVRHSYIAALLALQHIVVCINKMDLVDYSQEVFDKICDDYRKMCSHLRMPSVTFIPISAKLGDNVVNRSEAMPWYKGLPLLSFLEEVKIDKHSESLPMRMPVQYVIRPQSDSHRDFRGFGGRLACGSVKAGDRVKIYPSMLESTVKSVHIADKEQDSASAPQSVTISLNDEIDISRGSIIAACREPFPKMEQTLSMDVCWLMSPPLKIGNRYIVRHATQEVQAIVKDIEYKIDISTQQPVRGVQQLEMNDIASIVIKCAEPVVFDSYADNRTMGSLVFIDPTTNNTVGAGMLKASTALPQDDKACEELAERLNRELADATPQQVLRYFMENYPGQVALGSSLSYEDQVLTQMMVSTGLPPRIFTLDTGRLFPETYRLIERTNEKYKINIEVFFPDYHDVEQMVNKHGVNLFYNSVELRHECCRVRKIEPLHRALKGVSVWICGLRRDQSVTRTNMQLVEYDKADGLLKVNPLIAWSEEQLIKYVNDNSVPYNTLHRQGYPSIGCQPCTRAVAEGEDIRSGRWWWENPDHRECGLHSR